MENQINNVCLCGATRGTEHAAECPFPCYSSDIGLKELWEKDKFVLGEMRHAVKEMKKRMEEGRVRK